ncbi:hypothetical protein V1505DRAFT_33415 [Lipomyces doorenjongii]
MLAYGFWACISVLYSSLIANGVFYRLTCLICVTYNKYAVFMTWPCVSYCFFSSCHVGLLFCLS